MGTTASTITGSWIITCDGACWPNPSGPMGIGFTIDADGEIIRKHFGLPAAQRNSNNLAEVFSVGYALLEAAKLTQTRPKPELLVVRTDSQLILYQLIGKWKAKDPILRDCRDRCLKLIEQIGVKWEGQWIARELNEECDALSKAGYREVAGRDIPELQRRPA